MESLNFMGSTSNQLELPGETKVMALFPIHSRIFVEQLLNSAPGIMLVFGKSTVT